MLDMSVSNLTLVAGTDGHSDFYERFVTYADHQLYMFRDESHKVLHGVLDIKNARL